MNSSYFFQTIPKLGGTQKSNDDAVAIFDEYPVLRASVSDGASVSTFSALWSRYLVEKATQENERLNRDSLFDILNSAKEAINQFLIQKYPNPNAFVLSKIKSGGAATLLILELNLVLRNWNLFAYGDSVCILRKKSGIMFSYPIEHVVEFNSSPPLLRSSEPDYTSIVTNYYRYFKVGYLETGDTFYLMTDAIAKYCLTVCGEKAEIWDELQDISQNSEMFSQWIENKKSTKEIVDDDCSLVVISISGG